jgi:hypothetical protein
MSIEDKYLRDIAVDSNEDIYVAMGDGFIGNGIYKIVKGSQDLELYIDESNIKAIAKVSNIEDFFRIKKMFIKNDDLYIDSGCGFIKISDFKTKIQDYLSQNII